MKTQFPTWLCLGLLSFSACRDSSDSKLKLETDDRPSQRTEALRDVSSVVDGYVNSEIENARLEVNPLREEWTEDLRWQFVNNVGRRLSHLRPGTGVGIHVQGLNLEISSLSEIETHLAAVLRESHSEILFTKFVDSRYGDNPIGPLHAVAMSQMSSSTADHSIAPAIKVGETIVGMDKFGHFAEEGYWYFLAAFSGDLNDEQERLEFGQFMEGSPLLSKDKHPKYKGIFGRFCKTCVLLGGFGYYGMAATGVCSQADMNANEDGYQFFNALYQESGSYVFHIADYDLKRWNEDVTKNYYNPKLKVRP